MKGIALVGAVSVLQEEGYEFPRIAGTSAGAVVGALLAAEYPALELAGWLRRLSFDEFADPGLLDRLGLPGKALSVVLDQGVYEGKRVHRWVADRLAERGVHTFAQLRVEADPESSLPDDRRYRLVVMASDISRGRLARLPWDYGAYGLHGDQQPVADAVRASASIPFFYEPVRLKGRRNWEHVLVDGGMLSNFPVDAFDRTDGLPPRWPTFGVKLSARPDAHQRPQRVDNTFEFARALVSTMIGWHDQAHLDDPCVVRRTIFVDTMKVQATDFDLDDQTKDALYRNGREAALRFLDTWDFDDYVAECRQG